MRIKIIEYCEVLRCYIDESHIAALGSNILACYNEKINCYDLNFEYLLHTL